MKGGYFHLLGKYIVPGYSSLCRSHGEVSSQTPLCAYTAQIGTKVERFPMLLPFSRALFTPQRIKFNWATWQLTAAVNLKWVVLCVFVCLFSYNEGIGIFLKDSDFLNWHRICHTGSYNLRKNVWMEEIQWKESVYMLKAIKEKFYPKIKYSFCLPGLLSFMSFYLDFQFLLLL